MAEAQGCTPTRYLTGFFRHRTRELPPNKACHTPTTTRYGCSAARLQAEGLEWQSSSAECSSQPTPTLASAMLLGKGHHRRANRTLFIIGDSTQKQTADAAFCQIATELSADASRASPLFAKGAARNWQWRQPPWWWQTTPSDAYQKRLVSCAKADGASGGSVRLCFIPTATLGRTVLQGRDAATVSLALRKLVARLNVTRRTDLALINSGSWYMGQVSCAAGGLYIRNCDAAQAADAEAIVSLTASHAGVVPRLLWRETYATHFQTADGVFDGQANNELRLYVKSKGAAGNKSIALTECKPLPSAAVKPLVLANVSAILRSAAPHGASEALTVLDTWSPTRNLSVATHHVIRRGQDELAPPDCTHFCQWVGVDEMVLGAVAWAAVAPPRPRQP